MRSRGRLEFAEFTGAGPVRYLLAAHGAQLNVHRVSGAFVIHCRLQIADFQKIKERWKTV